jgi:hypothetical protein
MSNLSTSPASFQMASTERLQLDIDFTAYLEGVETVSTATAILTDTRTGYAYAAGVVSTVVASPTVSVVLDQLKPGATYRLVVTGVITSNKHKATETEIGVPF